MLWLLASDHKDGVIDAETAKLAFRLRMSPKEVDAALSPLIEKGFFVVEQGASNALADSERGAIPETEREAEGETEKRTTSSGKPDMVSLRAKASEVLEFLNIKAGRQYQPVDANLELIVARLRDGATETQLRQVVAKKCREWGSDEKMAEYLRPATLFNRTKFAQYQGELGVSGE